MGQNAAMPISDTDLAIMFITPMNAPGVKLFCRASYEMAASVMGTPFDYPLSSRFDENDAIFVFDNVLVPWENVLIHRDIEKIKTFYPRSGFLAGYQFQGCTRLAVKLDFMVGIIAKALRAAGSDEFRGNQAMLGEVIAWRNLFWALSDAQAMNPMKWVGDTVLPNAQSGSAYRVFAGDAFARIKEIVEKIVASSLIYLPSSAKDFKNPEIDPYLKRYVRGSYGIDYKERIKIMKLLWDAIGTEFGGRHELYERNYAGNHEDIRIHAMLERQGLRRARPHGCIGRAVHGRLRRGRLDRRHLAQPRRRCIPGSQPCMMRWAPSQRWNPLECMDELDRPTPRHGGRLWRRRGRHERGTRPFPRGDEPPRGRRPRHHHRRPRRHRRLHRDGGVLGLGRAADPAGLRQPRRVAAPMLRANCVLCVNTLRAGEEIVADTFAGRTKVPREQRFATGEWITLATGSPVLKSAVVAFDCRVIEVKSVASHDVYFCVAEAIHSGPPGAALVYHDRAYKQGRRPAAVRLARPPGQLDHGPIDCALFSQRDPATIAIGAGAARCGVSVRRSRQRLQRCSWPRVAARPRPIRAASASGSPARSEAWRRRRWCRGGRWVRSTCIPACRPAAASRRRAPSRFPTGRSISA